MDYVEPNSDSVHWHRPRLSVPPSNGSSAIGVRPNRYVERTVALVLLSAGIVMTACLRTDGATHHDRDVAATSSTSRGGQAVNVERATDFVGVLFSRDSLDIATRVDGVVLRLPFWPGDRVSAGSPLAFIDARAAEQELEDVIGSDRMAVADQRKAALELAQAEAQLQRASQLGNLVSAAELDGTRAQVAMARTRFDSAAAHARSLAERLRLSKRSSEDATLRAPFDGVVSVRYVEPGTFVHGGTRVLRFVGDGPLWVRFAIPEDRVGEVSIGDRVVGEQPALRVSFAGVVTGIAPEIDVATRTVFAEARVERGNDTGQLLAGLQARVRCRATVAERAHP